MEKKFLFMCVLLTSWLSAIYAEVDPNFYVYLCFGQSNMEGNATPEAKDTDYVDPRFQMLACVNFLSPQRKMGQWYTAYPPLVRQGTGLGMADYFGRTMVANLPENVKVGVVDVALAGVKIEGFISEEIPSYLENLDQDNRSKMENYFKAYGNDPYKRLVDMARIAQESGVIKGILLHQGESNNGQSDWPKKVKLIYDRLMEDLGLNPEEVPLFIGEMVNQAVGGSCYYHNAVIATMPFVIPNSYVISSADCPHKGDRVHFTAQGYRIMGQRYAKVALKVMGIDVNIDEPYRPATPFELDKMFTSLEEIGSTPVLICDEKTEMAFYGSTDQNLAFGSLTAALDTTNTVTTFRLEAFGNNYLLRGIRPNGNEYIIWNKPGYLNSQPIDGWCSFILGLNGQNGQDIENGAVWNIQYIKDRGFSLLNIGTGKYLHNLLPAMYNDPVFFNFYSLKDVNNGIMTIRSNNTNGIIYTLQGMKVGAKDTWDALPRGLYIIDGKKNVKR
jgi:hypothetical protein